MSDFTNVSFLDNILALFRTVLLGWFLKRLFTVLVTVCKVTELCVQLRCFIQAVITCAVVRQLKQQEFYSVCLSGSRKLSGKKHT